MEAVYQEALQIEFDLREIHYDAQPRISLESKGRRLEKHYQPDFLVYDRIVVEIKAQSALGSVDDAQIINNLFNLRNLRFLLPSSLFGCGLRPR